MEVEPICNFEGANSWGYNPNFYFAPDKVYGTAANVKQFVDLCHSMGMAVIMDLVMNHSFGSSPMVQMYWNGTLGIPAANSPWFNQYPTHADNVGYQFNHESPETIDFTRRVDQLLAYQLSSLTAIAGTSPKALRRPIPAMLWEQLQRRRMGQL